MTVKQLIVDISFFLTPILIRGKLHVIVLENKFLTTPPLKLLMNRPLGVMDWQ